MRPQPQTSHPARVCGEPRAHGVHTSHRHTQVHVRSRPPPVPGSPKLPPRLPRRRAHAALRGSHFFPAGVSPASDAAAREDSGTRRAPPPLGHPGVRTRGRTPGAGAAVASAAPGRALPSPARRPPGCSRDWGRRTAAKAGARASPGQRADGTGSHGALARGGPGTWPQPPGGPSRGLCVSAGAAASRACGR